MRLDAMPPEYRARFMNHPHLFVLEPFRVAGNLYFIGNKEIGCYLIDSGAGLIILDTGFENCAGQFMNSIWTLGFDPRNVKWIFHTHNHPDHIACTNLLVQLSGAKTFMSRIDGMDMVNAGPDARLPISLRFVPDVYTEDGDTFTLGNTTIRCVATPGHTRGNQSFFFNVADGERQYVAALHGGIGINTLHREFMEKAHYPQAREDFFAHLQRVRDWKVDIYLGSHTLQNRTEEKLAERKARPDGPNPFIDPGEWSRVMGIAWDMGHQLIVDEENGNVPEWQRHGY